MAPLLAGRLLSLARTQATISPAFQPLVLRVAAGASFSTTSPAFRQPDNKLPNLPPKPKSKSKDSAEGGKASTRASAPYDATKFSIAQLIGNDMTSALASSDYHAKPIRVPIRAVPSTGRTVHVSGPINPARAFAMLNQRCTQNRLATIANQQRFHERPGLKRKRLHRTRWRARFKKGFHATVVRVQELVRQGW